MTQAELAALVGVDWTTISRAERGETVPDYATIETLADILAVRLDDLVGRPADDGLGEPVTPPAAAAAAGSRSAAGLLPPGPIADSVRDLQDQIDALKRALRKRAAAEGAPVKKGRRTA